MDRSDQQYCFVGCSDFSGLVRGRAVPVHSPNVDAVADCGWVPADQSLTPFGEIGPSNPFGPMGDLRLRPDPTATYHVPLPGAKSPLYFALSDIVEFSGEPWACCARDYLKRGIASLREDHGLNLLVAFEQEFTLLDDALPAPVFSMRAYRRDEDFLSSLLQALQSAGLVVENILPEYGQRQFEVSLQAEPPLRAADSAVAFREIVREVARLHDRRITFSPVVAEGAVSNGVHIHFSFHRNGLSCSYDRTGPGQLSDPLARACEGILKHIAAVLAMTAPSALSYRRLKPHNWSASYGCIGLQNREAALRICPARAGTLPEDEHHVEFRAGDATSSPYLHLGSLVHCMLFGLNSQRQLAGLVFDDPDKLSARERRESNVRKLPDSLEDALVQLEINREMRSSAAPLFWECYLDMKRTELASVESLSAANQIQRYLEVY